MARGERRTNRRWPSLVMGIVLTTGVVSAAGGGMATASTALAGSMARSAVWSSVPSMEARPFVTKDAQAEPMIIPPDDCLGDPHGGFCELVNLNSGECLTVHNSGTANVDALNQYTCDTFNTSESWFTQPSDMINNDQVVSLNNFHSGLCADVYRAEITNLAQVDQYTCKSSDNQLWHAVYESAYDAYELINIKSGKCLEVYRAEISDSANVDQYTCHTGAGQLWFAVDNP